MTKYKEIIRLSKSCISEAEKAAVSGVLDREFLGMGAEVKEFENLLTEYFGRECNCVVNGTAAIQLALQACGIGYGDEVLIPSLTYVASFQAVTATGAMPVACDIDKDSLIFDWKDAQKRITKKTKAIIPVHYSGGVGDLNGIYKFATENNLRVIEDAAHAFGTIYQGSLIGSFGDIVCFSFDGIKNITSGEGGCIVSNDPVLNKKIKDIRLLGVQNDTEKRYAGQRSWEFDVTMQGWRYHMSNIMAAIGIEQFKRKEYFFKKRRDLAKKYDSIFEITKKVKILDRDYECIVPHIYVVILPSNIDRGHVQSKLLELGIQSGVHYFPNHNLTFYKNGTQAKLTNTDNISASMLSLPLHPDLNMEDIEYITNSLLEVLN
jgi:dTDP-4-amino-4,6-dideoxygalactose transaminase